jgi:dTDP-4-amino-4,6-dideoxygalactose transaminase
MQVDTDREKVVVDMQDLRNKLSPKTKVITFVHWYASTHSARARTQQTHAHTARETSFDTSFAITCRGGLVADLDEIAKIREECFHKFGFRPYVVEDCAHAFGSLCVLLTWLVFSRPNPIFSTQQSRLQALN